MATELNRPAGAPSGPRHDPDQSSPDDRRPWPRPQATADPELEHFLRLVTARIIAECTARWDREGV